MFHYSTSIYLSLNLLRLYEVKGLKNTYKYRIIFIVIYQQPYKVEDCYISYETFREQKQSERRGGKSDMFCQKCGTQIGEGADFCHKCGTKVVYENTAQPIEPEHIAAGQEEMNPVIENDADSFKKFVDEYIQANTKFSSAEALITSSKPWVFAWVCVGVLSLIGLLVASLPGVLIFGGFFGYAAVFITSGIIRMNYTHKFSGEFEQEISSEEFLAFLNEHLKIVSPYFHECGYLSERGGLLTSIGNAASRALNEAKICCECGPKKKSLATICIRPNAREQNTGKMQYFVGAVHKGFLIDGRAAGFLGHACLIRTAPILQAAMMYYLKNH